MYGYVRRGLYKYYVRWMKKLNVVRCIVQAERFKNHAKPR